jgi:hypothetical protein
MTDVDVVPDRGTFPDLDIVLNQRCGMNANTHAYALPPTSAFSSAVLTKPLVGMGVQRFWRSA